MVFFFNDSYVTKKTDNIMKIKKLGAITLEVLMWQPHILNRTKRTYL